MTEKMYIAELGSWQGFKVGSTGRIDYSVPDVRSEIWVELFPDESLPIECSGCEEVVKSVENATLCFERGRSGGAVDAEALTARLYQENGRLKMEVDFLQKKC